MNNTITYKGYIGSVEFSQEDCLLFGKVQGIRSLISYEGSDVKSLVDDFKSAIDDYLALCEEKGIEPEKAYKGSFNVRITPELHRKAAQFAAKNEMSLNSCVEAALSAFVNDR
ncbi:MAG: type II toxin-antitoxin system HicB family antitoxin [Clostridia bacterium]|nr:type II toxin-antitoxin system HicB family antitoxin [Clostridia bacterium]